MTLLIKYFRVILILISSEIYDSNRILYLFIDRSITIADSPFVVLYTIPYHTILYNTIYIVILEALYGLPVKLETESKRILDALYVVSHKYNLVRFANKVENYIITNIVKDKHTILHYLQLGNQIRVRIYND